MSAALRRGAYFLRRAGQAIARGPRLALVSTVTIFVAVFVIGLFAAALRGAERLMARWTGEVRISIYLDPSADLEAARAAAGAAAPGLAVEAVTAPEALRRFREALGPQGSLLEGIAPDVLGPSVEVRAAGLRLPQARALAARLEATPGAREVDYGEAWLGPLEEWVGRARWAGLLLLAVLGGGAAVLVANTLRLGVFARRDEIEIMKLVGATDTFVQGPFLLEGVLVGAAGGALAAGTLAALARFALPRLAGALQVAAPLRGEVLPAALAAGLVGGGAALGLVASALAVGRELGRRR